MKITKALDQLSKSYSPYSKFKVAAVLETESGELYTGVNIENASYSATNCAERTAFFSAINDGHRRFKSITIVGSSGEYIAPCGICRQVMVEFCDEDFKIILARSEDDFMVKTLGELMPLAFSGEDLLNDSI